MRALVLLTLLLSALPARADEMDVYSRACQTYNDLSDDGLNWIGALVKRLPGMKFSGSAQDTYVLNHPTAAFVLRRVACESWALSYSICANEGQDYAHIKRLAVGDETDAIRHFLFSTWLTCSRGAQFAEEFLVAHEGPPQKWNERTTMDLFNNSVGIAWAKETGHCNLVTDDARMAALALEMVRDGKLQILKSGKTACAKPEERRGADLATLVMRKANFLRQIQVKNGRACGAAGND